MIVAGEPLVKIALQMLNALVHFYSKSDLKNLLIDTFIGTKREEANDGTDEPSGNVCLRHANPTKIVKLNLNHADNYFYPLR